MSIFDNKINKSVAEAVMKVMQQEELKGNQHKIDANKNGKVDAHDFKLLRGKKGMKKEEVELNEAFPTVADAKKRMDAGKTSTGSVTKTKTGLVHKRDYKDEDESDDMQKKAKGYGARQNYKRSTRVNEELSFTEMLELYNEHGLKVLAPIETEEMDIDGTTIEVIDGDKINGYVETTVEEVTNDEFTKEFKDQQASFEGKKKQPKVAAGKTTGVKEMPEEVELDERSLTSDEKSEMEKNVKGMKKKLSGFKQRYGERAKEVMYATATKMAKKD
jgi:protein required for attachment to host cells